MEALYFMRYRAFFIEDRPREGKMGKLLSVKITKDLTKPVEFNRFSLKFCERSHKIEIF